MRKKRREKYFKPAHKEPWLGCRAPRCWELRVRRGHPTPTLFCLIVLTLKVPMLRMSSWTITL